jgi:diguanylate cyclase (GGDEF)-like protein/PAS domain S-box-containing protein
MISNPEIEVGRGCAAGQDAFATAVEAAETALSHIKLQPLSLVFVYASSQYDLSAALRGVAQVVGAVPVIGTTTAGEICDGGHQHSIVVAILASRHLTAYCAVGRNVAADWAAAVEEATSAEAVSRFFHPDSDVWRELTREGKSVFAILFVPGNTRYHDAKGHEILEAIKAKSLGRIAIVGGAAADEWNMEQNFVFLRQEAFADSLLLTIVETRLQFGISTTHGFKPTPLRAAVTGVRGNEILTIDGTAAADALPRLLGSDRHLLEGKHLSLLTGRLLGIPDAMGQYGVMVSTYMTPGNGCRVSRPLTPGTELTVMESGGDSMLMAARDGFRKALLRGDIHDPAVTILHYCALRVRIMGKELSDQEIGNVRELLSGTPLVGFYSFGEVGISEDSVSRYNNAAVSTLVIGKELAPAARVAVEAEGLRRELERRANELEEKVAERTSELALSNSKLRETQKFLDAVIENVPAMLVVKEARENRFVLVNRAGEQLLGLSRGDLIGKNDHDFFPGDEADAFVAADRAVLQSEAKQVIKEEPIHTRCNGVRFLRTTEIPIGGDDGKTQYLLSVSEDVTEQRRAAERIAHLARHDTLTDLPNRMAFSEALASALAAAHANRKSFALMCADFDRFKEVNDVFGHATGDAVLLEATRRLKAVAGSIFLGRLGGDEFVLIASDINRSEAEHLADRLIAAVSEDFDIEGNRIQIGLSVGIAMYPANGTDASAILRNADAALYRAKAERASPIRVFDPGIDHDLRVRNAMLQALKQAVRQDEFDVHYQPQTTIDGAPVGFEALIRWRHEALGLIPPSRFIPLAEECGLISRIGDWVLQRVCREAASWPIALQAAINLSPIQFRYGDLVGVVHKTLLETGLAPTRLELEITEGVLVNDFSRAVSVLRRLKSFGVKIALDDFGKGYSSLSYLQAFPFDKIKIDPVFLTNLHRDSRSAAIIHAVVSLGHELGLSIVAEGVETPTQLDFLRQQHCDQVQGYLIGRPAPIERYAALVGRKPGVTVTQRAG